MVEDDRQDLMTLNRLDELLKPKQDGQLARITAITRSAGRILHESEVIQEEKYNGLGFNELSKLKMKSVGFSISRSI